MAHSLILGMTMSGKSTLARQLVRQYRAKGTPSLILDPIGDPAWKTAGAQFVTDDGEKFLAMVEKSRSCAIFVDESGDAIGRYAGEMRKLGTRSRHYGHNAHFLSQRAVDIDKTIRDQCANLFCFRVSKPDAKTLADEFSNDLLLQCANLDQGEFISCGRFRPAKRLKLF